MPANLDPVTNFAKVQVSSLYSAAASQVLLVSGEGTKLPSTAAGQFNLVWYDSTVYTDPADDPNREIIRVNSRAGDTLWVSRGQEGTAASTKSTSGSVYRMLLAPTQKLRDDLAKGPACLLIKTDVQTIANATWTAITWTEATVDTDGMFTVASATRLTFQTSGVYWVHGGGAFAQNSIGNRYWAIGLNGTRRLIQHVNPAADLAGRGTVGLLTRANPGDYAELYVLQEAGAPLTVASLTDAEPRVGAHYLGSGVE